MAFDSCQPASGLSSISAPNGPEEISASDEGMARPKALKYNRMAQRRYRERQKEKREGLEDQVSVLTKRIADLQCAHDSLTHRNRTLERFNELAEAREPPSQQSMTQVPDVDRRIPEDEQFFAVVFTDMVNVFREPHEQLSVEQCSDWHKDPARFKCLRIDSAKRIYRMLGETLDPSPEIRDRVIKLVEHQRELREKMMELFHKRPVSWTGTHDYKQQEFPTTVPAVLPDLANNVGLSDLQIADLVKARRQYCAESSEIKDERAEILHEIKLSNAQRLHTRDSLGDVLSKISGDQQRLQHSLEREGRCMKQFALTCMNVVTPWQETRFALEAYISHGLILDVSDIAAYYDNLEQYNKAPSLLNAPAAVIDFSGCAANTDHPMSSIFAAYQVSD